MCTLLVQIPRAKAITMCASDQPDMGMAAALQPEWSFLPAPTTL